MGFLPSKWVPKKNSWGLTPPDPQHLSVGLFFQNFSGAKRPQENGMRQGAEAPSCTLHTTLLCTGMLPFHCTHIHAHAHMHTHHHGHPSPTHLRPPVALFPPTDHMHLTSLHLPLTSPPGPMLTLLLGPTVHTPATHHPVMGHPHPPHNPSGHFQLHHQCLTTPAAHQCPKQSGSPPSRLAVAAPKQPFCMLPGHPACSNLHTFAHSCPTNIIICTSCKWSRCTATHHTQGLWGDFARCGCVGHLRPNPWHAWQGMVLGINIVSHGDHPALDSSSNSLQ